VVRKGSSSFDVLGIDTKDKVEVGDAQEAPSMYEGNKDNDCEEDVQEVENQETSPFLLMIGLTRDTTTWKFFLEILRRE